ncbi:MAG: ATP-dependent zinc metalloprotease FtsH [Planctomycetota bacterium]
MPQQSSPNPPTPNQGKGPDGKPPQPGPPRFGRGAMGWLAILGLMLVLLLLFQTVGPQATRKTWAEFTNIYNEGSISEVIVKSDRIEGVLVENSADGSSGRIMTTFHPSAVDHWTAKVDELTTGNFTQPPGPSFWVTLLFSPLIFMLLLILVVWFLIFRAMRSAGGGAGMLGSFGKSRHRVLMKESTGVTFKDVAGVEEAKEEVEEIARFLKDPKRFMRLGGRIPRGVLLTGPPGCGKTLLAKAIAGEADVPFFSISGSDFVEMFVGVGASRVRDLFKQARDNSPCIIFLDEIDAVGRKRGGGFSTGGHDEREQTLNAILVEMDGFDSGDQIIVIASTNRPDVLDPALTRPGRFDRQIAVALPDVKGRYEILQVHARKVKLAADADLEVLARGTPMFSGAELEAIINEAAIIATLADKEAVDHEDLEEARDKVRFGRARKSRKVVEKERIATAYHEAGHAVLQCLLQDADPLHKVTIIPRGQTGGATFSLPEDDRNNYSERFMLATMRVLCGGRIAEQRQTDDVTSGAAMDIRMVTSYARHMILEWGMSDKLGFVDYTPDDGRDAWTTEKIYSDQTASVVDAEVRRLSDDAYREAESMITEHWDRVVAIAEALLTYETLTAAEVNRLMEGKPLGKPTVSDLLSAEAEKLSTQPTSTPRRSRDADEGEQGFGSVLPSPA